MLHDRAGRAKACIVAAALTLRAGEAAAAGSHQALAAIFGELDDHEYYVASFARAKDRGVVTHTSTGKAIFHMLRGDGAAILESTFDAQFDTHRDGTTSRLREDGAAEIVLDAWDGATFPVELLHRETRLIPDPERTDAGLPSEDWILIVGRYAEANGVSAFTLALTEFDLPG